MPTIPACRTTQFAQTIRIPFGLKDRHGAQLGCVVIRSRVSHDFATKENIANCDVPESRMGITHELETAPTTNGLWKASISPRRAFANTSELDKAIDTYIKGAKTRAITISNKKRSKAAPKKRAKKKATK